MLCSTENTKDFMRNSKISAFLTQSLVISRENHALDLTTLRVFPEEELMNSSENDQIREKDESFEKSQEAFDEEFHFSKKTLNFVYTGLKSLVFLNKKKKCFINSLD